MYYYNVWISRLWLTYRVIWNIVNFCYCDCYCTVEMINLAQKWGGISTCLILSLSTVFYTSFSNLDWLCFYLLTCPLTYPSQTFTDSFFVSSLVPPLCGAALICFTVCSVFIFVSYLCSRTPYSDFLSDFIDPIYYLFYIYFIATSSSLLRC